MSASARPAEANLKPAAVGIDLGTTHVVVAFVPSAGSDADVAIEQAPRLRATIFPIAQAIAAGTIAARPLLPSVLFAELSDPALRANASVWEAGLWARTRAGEVPERGIVSAKSWLAATHVDREAAILPWQRAARDADADAEPAAPKLSPVAAQTRLLQHVHDAWNAAHPAQTLATLPLVVTIPASFDETARRLTLAALAAAGLGHARLLEEPQAAFLAALGVQQGREKSELRDGMRVLVVDVGGGTTDLSLLAVSVGSSVPLAPFGRSEAQSWVAERLAVGPHLLLGGDNCDLALAAHVEKKLALRERDGTTQRLTSGQFAALVAACRAAKETLLDAQSDAPQSVPITIVGRGSNLFANTLRTSLDRAEIDDVILDGFFPVNVLGSGASPGPRAAVVSVGLRYERQPAITQHVASFVRAHGPVDAVLFAGGVFEAPALCARVKTAIEQAQAHAVSIFPGAGGFEAVAKGAALFAAPRDAGTARARLRQTTAHAYYVQVAPNDAVLVLPRGSETDVVYEAEQTLVARIGVPSRFVLLASPREDAAPRHVPQPDDLRSALVALLPGKKQGSGASSNVLGSGASPGRDQQVTVRVAAVLTPLGTISVVLRTEDGTRHELTFETGAPAIAGEPAPAKAPRPVSGDEPDRRMHEAIVQAFAGADAGASLRLVKDLVRDLEKQFGERKSWSASRGRALVDALLPLAHHRRKSADHERVYLLLLGFGLRPGLGVPGDEPRVQRTFLILRERLAFGDKTAVQQAYFVALRRVAGGLKSDAQALLFSQWNRSKTPLVAKEEARSAFVALEALPLAEKRILAASLVDRCLVETSAPLWNDFGRLGARVPLFAGAEHAVPAEIAEAWLSDLLRVPWEKTYAAPLVSVARLTGDRDRDLSERIRRDVAQKLAKLGVAEDVLAPLNRLVPLSRSGNLAVSALGEELPLGLTLPDV